MQKNNELSTVTIRSLVFRHLLLVVIAFVLAYISYDKAMMEQNVMGKVLCYTIAFLFIGSGVFLGLEMLLRKTPIISITPEKLRYSALFREIDLTRNGITTIKTKRKFMMSFLKISYHEDNITIPIMGFSKSQTEKVLALLKPL